MSAKIQSKVFTLCESDLDLFLEWLEEVQVQMGMDARNRLRVRLLAEEMLIRMHDNLGAEASLSGTCDSRFGRARLIVSVEGDQYNPLIGAEPELGDWDSSLRTAIELTPQYAYDGRRNTLKFSLPNKRMNPVLRIAIALLLGVAAGLLGIVLAPADLRNLIVEVALDPTYNMWSRLLNAISGPIIFCTVVTTMLNTRRIDERGGSSLLVILRYFAISIALVAVALLCSLSFFNVNLSNLEIDRQLGRELYAAFVETVPANLVDPFVESNTSQLLLIAFALGYVLVKLGDRTTLLRKGVREANSVGLKLAEWVSLLVPTFTGVFVCLELWQGRVDVLGGMWKPIVVAFVVSSLTMCVEVVFFANRFKVSPALLLHKLWPPFEKAMGAGSLDASFAEAWSSCTNLLGIDAGLVKVGLPQGLVLYMPISAVGTIVFTLFVADQFGVRGDPVWFASAVIMAVVVFVATPPVPGANLLAYIALFKALGVPSDALLDAMVFDVVFGIFAGAANQAMLQLEIAHHASTLGLLNRETLVK